MDVLTKVALFSAVVLLLVAVAFVVVVRALDRRGWRYTKVVRFVVELVFALPALFVLQLVWSKYGVRPALGVFALMTIFWLLARMLAGGVLLLCNRLRGVKAP